MSIASKAIVIIYLMTNLIVLCSLSVYDYKHLMLDKKLFFAYVPISVLSVIPNTLQNNMNIGYVLLTSVVSAIILYCAFFIMALIPKSQLGGGDVKLIPFIAFSFGPYIQSVLIFMVISMIILLCVVCVYNLISKIRKIPEEIYKKSRLNGPYPAIPFMFVGSLITAVFQVIKII